MNGLQKSLFTAAPALLLAAILSGCSSSASTATVPAGPVWSADDTSCRVVDMHYVCMRQCQTSQTGPSGAACINRKDKNTNFCDCGTRTKAPAADKPLNLE